MVEIGIPLWTSGQFTRRVAEDDLGLESVGAGLLRRLLPGIVQTTPNAGYYGYYPYLLAKWEERTDSVSRAEFRDFYRRQEAAYALACLLHDHRGDLGGIQGARKGLEAVRLNAGEDFDVARIAEDYMDSPLGGYGLFYARVVEDMRLSRAGARGYVDRATDEGQTVAAAFAISFEDTRYYREYFDADRVPRDVLA